LFPADLARVILSATPADWELVRWIEAPPLDVFLADLKRLGESLILVEEPGALTGRPELGGQVFVGAVDGAGDRFWGVGIDGDRACQDCCLSVPGSGTVTKTSRFVCQSG